MSEPTPTKSTYWICYWLAMIFLQLFFLGLNVADMVAAIKDLQ